MNEDVKELTEAKVGDLVDVWEDVEGLTEFGWVSSLDYFDERDNPVLLRRIRLLVLEAEDIVLPVTTVEEDE